MARAMIRNLPKETKATDTDTIFDNGNADSERFKKRTAGSVIREERLPRDEHIGVRIGLHLLRSRPAWDSKFPCQVTDGPIQPAGSIAVADRGI